MSVVMEFTERRVLRRKSFLLQEALPLTTKVLLDFQRQGLLTDDDIKEIKKRSDAKQKMDRLLDILNDVKGFSLQKLCYLLEQQKLDWVADELQAELSWEKGKLKVEYYIQMEADLLMNKHLTKRKGQALDAIDISRAGVAVAGKMQVTKSAWQRQVSRKGRVVSDEVTLLQEDIDRMNEDIGFIINRKDNMSGMKPSNEPQVPSNTHQPASNQTQLAYNTGQTPRGRHVPQGGSLDEEDEEEEEEEDAFDSTQAGTNEQEKMPQDMNSLMRSENGLVRFIGGTQSDQRNDETRDDHKENKISEKGPVTEEYFWKGNAAGRQNAVIHENEILGNFEFKERDVANVYGIMDYNVLAERNDKNQNVVKPNGMSEGMVSENGVRHQGQGMIRENAMIRESGGRFKDLDSSYDSDIPLTEHDSSADYEMFDRTTTSTKSSGVFSDDNRVHSGKSRQIRKRASDQNINKVKVDGRYSVTNDSGRGSVPDTPVDDQPFNKVETKHSLVKKLSNKIRELSQVLQDVLNEQQTLLAERDACYKLLGIDPEQVADGQVSLEDMLKSKLQSIAKEIDDKEYEIHHGNSMAKNTEEQMHKVRKEMAQQLSFKNNELEKLQRQIRNYEAASQKQNKVMEKGRHDRDILLSQIEYWKRRCDLLEKSRRLGYYYEHWYHSTVGKKCCILQHSTDYDTKMLAQYEKLGIQYGKMAFDQAITSLPDLSKVGVEQAEGPLNASWSEADYGMKLTNNPHANIGKDARFHYRSPYVGPSTVKGAKSLDSSKFESPRKSKDASRVWASVDDSTPSPRPPQGAAPARKFRVNRPCRSNSPERPAEDDTKVVVKQENGTVTYTDPEVVKNLHQRNKDPVFHHRSCCPACCAISRRMKQK